MANTIFATSEEAINYDKIIRHYLWTGYNRQDEDKLFTCFKLSIKILHENLAVKNRFNTSNIVKLTK